MNKYKVGQTVIYTGVSKREVKNGESYKILRTDNDDEYYELDGLYNWWVDEDETKPVEKRLEYGYCEIGDIIVNGAGYECTILDVRERLVNLSAYSDYNSHGCTLTYEELQKRGYTIKQDEPVDDIVEVTLEEISKLKGISVDKLRIKE